MGRPGRKRPRPPLYSFTEVDAAVLFHEPQVPLVPHPLRNSSGSNDLRALVISATRGTRITATKADEDADKEEGPKAVQQVWGAVTEVDIAAAPGNVDVDGAGVAWLVNSATRLSEMGYRPSSSSLPQRSTSDHHDVVAEAAAAVPEMSIQLPLLSIHHHGNGQQQQQQDGIKVAPPSGAPFFACDASLLEKLSRAKGEFDEIPVAVFKRVRSACNPAEALGRGAFLNRSAMKLANIDAIVGGQLALGGSGGPRQEEDTEKQKREAVALGVEERCAGCEPLQAKALPPSIQPAAKEVLLFADLCGGPGGFSEYLLRKRRQIGLPARGWGISLREGEGGGGGDSGIGVVDSTAADGHSGNAAVVGDDDGDTDNGGGGSHDHRRRYPFFSRGEEAETPVVPEKTNSTTVAEGPPISAAHSMASRLSGRVGEEGSSRHHGGPQEQEGNRTEADPCAWRLNHLRSCCNVLVSTAGMKTPATTTTTTKFSGGGKVSKNAEPTVASAITATATATATVVPPLLEMRIDYGPTGTGDVTDVDNMQGFVDTILASTAERRLDLVVADGGFGAARDALEQERLLSPLLHSEVRQLNGAGISRA